MTRNVCLLMLVLLMAACGREPLTPLAAEDTDAAVAPFTAPAYYVLLVHRALLPGGQAAADLCGIDAPPVQQIGTLTIQETLYRSVTAGTIPFPSVSGGTCQEVVGHPVTLDLTGAVIPFSNRINLTVGSQPRIDIFFTDGDLPQRFNFTHFTDSQVPVEAVRVSGLIGRTQ